MDYQKGASECFENQEIESEAQGKESQEKAVGFDRMKGREKNEGELQKVVL